MLSARSAATLLQFVDLSNDGCEGEFALAEKEEKKARLWVHWLQYGELVSFRVHGYCGPAYLWDFLFWSDDFSAELLDFLDVFVGGLDLDVDDGLHVFVSFVFL